MATILLAAPIVLLAVVGLALGPVFGRPPLKGTCGGLTCSSLNCGTCPKRKRMRRDR